MNYLNSKNKSLDAKSMKFSAPCGIVKTIDGQSNVKKTSKNPYGVNYRRKKAEKTKRANELLKTISKIKVNK